MDEPLSSQASPTPVDPTQPNISTDALTSLCRVSTVLAISLISLWANYEASKGFDITVLQAPGASLAARRYNLMFVSNGAAARAILNASASIERTLYPDAHSFPRKPINSVTLHVADYNLTHAVVASVTAGGRSDYVIHMSANIVEERDVGNAVVAAVYLGMVKVWVRDGRGEAPTGVVDGVVGYVWRAAGFGNGTAEGWEEAVGCCEKRRPGFVARLNREMEGRWEDGIWEDALGTSVGVMCTRFRAGVDWVEDRVGNLTGRMVEL